MKHLGPHLAHSRISVNIDSRHFFPGGVRVTVSPRVICPLCKVYPVGLSVFLLGEMRSGSNSKTELLKKHWLLLLPSSPAPASSPSRWNKYGSDCLSSLQPSLFMLGTLCRFQLPVIGGKGTLQAVVRWLRTALWFGKQSQVSASLG